MKTPTKPASADRAVSGQSLRASRHHAIQTGMPIVTAQTATATGPSSPAGSVTPTVTAPVAEPWPRLLPEEELEDRILPP